MLMLMGVAHEAYHDMPRSERRWYVPAQSDSALIREERVPT